MGQLRSIHRDLMRTSLSSDDDKVNDCSAAELVTRPTLSCTQKRQLPLLNVDEHRSISVKVKEAEKKSTSNKMSTKEAPSSLQQPFSDGQLEQLLGLITEAIVHCSEEREAIECKRQALAPNQLDQLQRLISEAFDEHSRQQELSPAQVKQLEIMLADRFEKRGALRDVSHTTETTGNWKEQEHFISAEHSKNGSMDEEKRKNDVVRPVDLDRGPTTPGTSSGRHQVPSKRMMYQRKCPFHVKSDIVKFDNMPGIMERAFIRMIHYFSRLIIQAGAFQSSNPLIWLLAFFFYVIDGTWAGVDKQYYVKRKAMYGPNFISVLSVFISKYDPQGTGPDSFDARMLTIQQRRGFFLGSTIMNQSHLPHSEKNKGEAGEGKGFLLSPLHISDPGVAMNPELRKGQPDHNAIRHYIMKHVFDDEKSILERTSDNNAKVMLIEFATQAKGITDPVALSPILEQFLVRYLIYAIFDVPVETIPQDLLHSTYYKDLKFVFYYYWPKNPTLSSPKAVRDNLDKLNEYFAKESPIYRRMQDVEFFGDDVDGGSLSRTDLMEIMHFIVGIAALQGTKALATTVLTQMPKGYAVRVAHDDEMLFNAVLECSRLDTPVTGAHCVVDDKEGLTTQIGGRTFTFGRGTTIFTGMTLANVDGDRFPDPFVFDPQNRDFTKLTSFHSVGERTNPDAPRICPGRRIAIGGYADDQSHGCGRVGNHGFGIERGS